MATELDRIVERILLATGDLLPETIHRLMRSLEENKTADTAVSKSLDQLLVAEKLIDETEAAELREFAQEVMQAPLIPGYTLIRKLGEGEMGAVFQAIDDQLNRPVALKILPKRLMRDRTYVERFCREAHSLTSLDHPHIVRGYQLGTADDVPFVTMELADGGSVERLIKGGKRLDVEDAVSILRSIAQALAYAHARKIVHRDIKPDNILFNRKGVVKLADLGLAQPMDEAYIPRSGGGVGTPYYMSPEQARRAPVVDGRSDLYALGASFYRILTGVVPFEGTTPAEVLQAKERGIFTPASSLNPKVPASLDQILRKLMASNPADRYQTATDLLTDLDTAGFSGRPLSFIESAAVPVPPFPVTASIRPPRSETSLPWQNDASTGNVPTPPPLARVPREVPVARRPPGSTLSKWYPSRSWSLIVAASLLGVTSLGLYQYVVRPAFFGSLQQGETRDLDFQDDQLQANG